MDDKIGEAYDGLVTAMLPHYPALAVRWCDLLESQTSTALARIGGIAELYTGLDEFISHHPSAALRERFAERFTHEDLGGKIAAMRTAAASKVVPSDGVFPFDVALVQIYGNIFGQLRTRFPYTPPPGK